MGAADHVKLFQIESIEKNLGSKPKPREDPCRFEKDSHAAGVVVGPGCSLDGIKMGPQGSLGLLTTHAADSLTTDSAAAATALARGCKAKTGMLGVCEDGSIPKSVLEIAKEKGMRIGLVTNSTIYDASPAALAA